MKLSELAKKVSELPGDDSFTWAGPEQFSDYNFDVATASHDDLVKYIDSLRRRMSDYAMALHELQKAYRKMRDVMLEASVE